MDFSLYEKIIFKQTLSSLIIGLVVLILAVFSLIYIFKNMRDEKLYFCLLCILCIIAIVGTIVLGGHTIYAAVYDVKNQAYVSYQGNFIFDDDIDSRNGVCSLYIPDKSGLLLETEAYLLEAGKYTGEVVYGEKTKVTLRITIEERVFYPFLDNTGD